MCCAVPYLAASKDFHLFNIEKNREICVRLISYKHRISAALRKRGGYQTYSDSFGGMLPVLG